MRNRRQQTGTVRTLVVKQRKTNGCSCCPLHSLCEEWKNEGSSRADKKKYGRYRSNADHLNFQQFPAMHISTFQSDLCLCRWGLYKYTCVPTFSYILLWGQNILPKRTRWLLVPLAQSGNTNTLVTTVWASWGA